MRKHATRSYTETAMLYHELEIEFEGTMVPPSGDGWNEPHDGGGVEDVRLVLGAPQIADVRKSIIQHRNEAALHNGDTLSDSAIESIVSDILRALDPKFDAGAEEALTEAAEARDCDE